MMMKQIAREGAVVDPNSGLEVKGLCLIDQSHSIITLKASGSTKKVITPCMYRIVRVFIQYLGMTE